ncbi:Putative uncharacterized protein [Lactobacillus delbrueckii subsp. lactis]|nr:Putative uncharacterized protein [Lactobacillus delbrueckii subsp. lactis]
MPSAARTTATWAIRPLP